MPTHWPVSVIQVPSDGVAVAKIGGMAAAQTASIPTTVILIEGYQISHKIPTLFVHPDLASTNWTSV